MLIVAKGFDGLEARRLEGGPEAAGDSHQRQDHERHRHYPDRSFQEDVALVVGGFVELAVERHRRDDDRQQPGSENAQRSADKREYQGLDEELHQDLTRAGADGLEQADLAGTLGDADQHDVHDTNTTDSEGEVANDAEQRVKADGEGLQHLSALDGVPFGRGLRVAGLEMMAPGDDVSGSHEGFGVQVRGNRLEDDDLRVLGVGNFVEDFVGDKRLLVVRAFVHRVLDLGVHDADDFEAASLDQDGLTDRGTTLEDAFGSGVSEQDHWLAAGEFTFFDVASFRGREFAHGGIRKLDASGLDGDHAGAGLESEIGGGLGTDGANDGDLRANRLDVFVLVVDLASGALASGLHAGLAGPDDDDVVAHRSGCLQDAAAQAFSEGEQEHEGHNAPTDAEHGQHGAHAISPQGGPTLLNQFLEKHAPPRFIRSADTRSGPYRRPVARDTCRHSQ